MEERGKKKKGKKEKEKQEEEAVMIEVSGGQLHFFFNLATFSTIVAALQVSSSLCYLIFIHFGGYFGMANLTMPAYNII